jgi:parallel beta-helix repeat protein
MSSVHHPINVLWALALIFLLAVPVALPYGNLLDARPSNRQLLKDEWDVYGNESVINQTIILTGNLTLTLGAQLTLKDSTLSINLTSDKQYNILVEDGGKLILENTVIKSYTPGHRFRFDVINATMTTSKSTIENYTSLSFIDAKAVLNNTSFLDNGDNSIIMADSDVKMYGCIVNVKGKGSALIVFQSALDMKSSTLRNLGLPVNIGINHTWSSNISVTNGGIYNFSTGVLFHGDHLKMDKVAVSGSGDDGVRLVKGSSDISNSNFSSNYQSINCDRATSANITNNQITAQNAGIVLNLCKSRVEGNTVTSSQNGIYVLGGPSNITKNILRNNKVGLQWSNSNNGSIERNTFSDNDRGAVLSYSTMNVKDCQFSNKVTDIVSDGSAVSMLNSTFTKDIIEDLMGRIQVFWNLEVLVQSPAAVPVPGATVEVTDLQGKTIIETTGSDGKVHGMMLQERTDTRYSHTNNTPYIIDARNSTAHGVGQLDLRGAGLVIITLVGLDMSISNISLSLVEVHVGSPIFINVTVDCNVHPLLGIGMDLLEDGFHFTSTYFNQTDGQIVVMIKYVPGTPGMHQLTVKLDPTNTFKESNESNNQQVFNVKILDNGGGGGGNKLPDLRPLGVSTDTTGLTTGNPVKINIQIENVGDADASNVQVQLSVDDKNIGLKTIATITAGESATTSFSWDGTTGKHTIRVVVDPGDLVQESNETNNIAEQQVDLSGTTSGLNNVVMGACVGILVIMIMVVLVIIFIIAKKSKPPAQPHYQYGQTTYPQQQLPNTPYFPGTYAPTQSPAYAPRTPVAPEPTKAPDFKSYKPPKIDRAPDPERIPTGLCPRCDGTNIKYFDDGHKLCQDCRKIFF